MLAYVPVAFDVYRPLKPRLRWAMQCLVSFADHAARCFPSIRTFAARGHLTKSAAGRDLAALTELGSSPASADRVVSTSTGLTGNSCRNGRSRRCPKAGTCRPGPPLPGRRIGRPEAVPAQGTEENLDKKNQGWARGRAQFVNAQYMTDAELPDDS